MHQVQDKIDGVVSESKDIFLVHMEEKYDKTFLPISYSSAGVVTGEEFRCYAEGSDRERDVVTVIRREENGEEVFRDDYFGICIRDAYEARVQEICAGEFGEVKVYIYSYGVSFFDNSLTSEHTMDDAIEMGQSLSASKFVYLEVEPGTEEAFQEACDRICRMLQEQKLTGIVKFFGLAGGQLEIVTEHNYLECIPSLVEPDGEICLMMNSQAVVLE